MKDLIKEVALEVSEKLVGSYLLDSNQEYSEEFATAFLAELSKRAEAVGEVNHGLPCCIEWTDEVPDQRTKLFTFPPIHDIEAIENRVAEACAKLVRDASFKIGQTSPYRDLVSEAAELLRSGEWRKYK